VAKVAIDSTSILERLLNKTNEEGVNWGTIGKAMPATFMRVGFRFRLIK
jgi:hypothetical protein